MSIHHPTPFVSRVLSCTISLVLFISLLAEYMSNNEKRPPLYSSCDWLGQAAAGREFSNADKQQRRY